MWLLLYGGGGPGFIIENAGAGKIRTNNDIFYIN